MFADRFNGVTGSAIRDIFKTIAQPGMISFAGGNPALDALENDVIAGIADDVLRSDGKRILQYGGSEGYTPLLEQAPLFLRERGVDAAADTILPVSGSTQAIDLLCKAFINPGDTIIVEDPTFLGATQTMRLYQANLVPVALDGDGVDPGELERAIIKHKPKLVYLIPTFQNPTGVTLSLERRKVIAELAAKHNTYIIEDDPYRDLRYGGDALPSIFSLAEPGRVIYLASFSKLISPGLRIAVMTTGGGDMRRKLVIGMQSTGLHSDQLAQAITAEYLRRGLLPGHIKSIRGLYGEKLRLMLAGLAAMDKDIQCTIPQGGLFVWARLREGADAFALLRKAVERRVAFVPGTHFYVGGGHNETLRLNFSNSTAEDIKKGLDALADAIRAF